MELKLSYIVPKLRCVPKSHAKWHFWSQLLVELILSGCDYKTFMMCTQIARKVAHLVATFDGINFVHMLIEEV